MISKIQLFGERHSGTTWLEYLIRDNIREVEIVFNHGWKHGLPNYNSLIPIPEDTLFLIIHKNPYSWLLGMFEHPHHLPELAMVSWEDFLSNDFRSYDIITEQKIVETFDNIFKCREEKIALFLLLRKVVKNIEFIKYEELLENPKIELDFLAIKYNLAIWDSTIILEKYCLESAISIETFNKKDFYLKEEFFKKIPQHIIEYITANLNWKLEEQIGYSKYLGGSHNES
jgi:hypothetical protein